MTSAMEAIEAVSLARGRREPTTDAERRWEGRAGHALLLRAAILTAPVVASVAASLTLARALPRSSGWIGAALWWAILLAVSTVVLVATERVARRLLPLAALLKVTMVFPDRAPSRVAVAKRSGSVKNLEERIAHARSHGVDSEPVRAAEEILGLVAVLNAHDRQTRGHSERVRALSELIAEEMKLPQVAREKLRWSALLHDVGKIHVHADILNKESELDDHEWEALLRHPDEGAKLASPLRPWLGEWALAIEQHHERFDGKGYPRALAGDDLSLGARIVAVADCFDTMVSARPYKSAMSPAAAKQELASCAGEQFDPVVVRAFLNISIGRLRLAMGPLSWITQMPLLNWVQNFGGQVASATGAVAGVGALAVGGVLSPPALRQHEPAAVVVEQVSTSQPTTTSPVSAPPVPAPPVSAPPVPVSPAPAAIPPPTAAPTATAAPTTPPTTAPPTTAPTTPTTTPPTTAPPTTSPTTAPPTTAPPPLPAPPVAFADSATTDEDTAVILDVAANDSNPDASALTIAITAPSANGSASVTGTSISYTPDPDWSGSDSLTYEVCDPDGQCSTAVLSLTVSPVNDPPTAWPDRAAVTKNQSVTIVVQGNDSEPDGDTLTTTILAGPGIGTASVDVSGQITYLPGGFRGETSLTYRVCDIGGLCGAAEVSIWSVDSDKPEANDDSTWSTPDQPVDLYPLFNDADAEGDIDPTTLRVEGAPSGSEGTAALTAPGAITFTPNAAFTGEATFTYKVCDLAGNCSDSGRITVYVGVDNTAPTPADDAMTVSPGGTSTLNLLANDTDAEANLDRATVTVTAPPGVGSVAIDDSGRAVFSAPADFSGTTSFTYEVCDALGLCATATVTVSSG